MPDQPRTERDDVGGAGGATDGDDGLGGTSEQAPRVEMYGKPGCHLCEVAVAVVSRVCSEVGESWVDRDISGDPGLMHAYGEHLPVTFVDGRQHDFWRVDEHRLRSALARPATADLTQARGRRLRRPDGRWA